MNETRPEPSLPIRIAGELRRAIAEGQIAVEARLPAEGELAELFGVSRPTMREALKRLAAQGIIRTMRGAQGGAFVTRLAWADAVPDQAAMLTLLMAVNRTAPEAALAAAFALTEGCLAAACAGRSEDDLAALDSALRHAEFEGETGFREGMAQFFAAVARSTRNPVVEYLLSGLFVAVAPSLASREPDGIERTRLVLLARAVGSALAERNTANASEAWATLATFLLERSEAARLSV